MNATKLTEADATRLESLVLGLPRNGGPDVEVLAILRPVRGSGHGR